MKDESTCGSLVTLRRTTETAKSTIGELVMSDGNRICVTLELPDRENKRNISRVPAGRYICKKYPSKKYGVTYQVMDVKDRSGILFHWGNGPGNTEGCILVGTEAKEDWITKSRDAFAHFIESMRDVDWFYIDIIDATDKPF